MGFTIRRVKVKEYGADKTRVPYCIDYRDGDEVFLIIGSLIVKTHPRRR